MYNPPEIVRHDRLPTALVAGGAGFLGAALCENLLTQNLRVVAVDNLETGRRENLKNILSHPRFALFEHNLNSGWPEKIKSVDFIFHLAAHEIHLANKDKNVTLDSLLTNALSTHHLLEFTRQSRARFLFASTLDVYQGIVSATDLRHYFGPAESDEKIFSHAEAKRFAESLVWEYFKKYDLDVRLVRLGELYGPGMDLGSAGVLGKLLQETLAGKDTTIEGEGLEKNYYCYITDAVNGLNLALFKDKTKGKIFSLAELAPVTTLEQAYLLKKMAQRNIEVIFKPAPRKFRLPEAPPFDGPSQKELGWAPRIDFKEGLLLTLRSFNYPLSPHAEQAARTIAPATPSPLTIKKPQAKVGLPIPTHSPKTVLIGAPSLSSKRLAVLALSLALLFLLRPLFALTYYGWQAVRALDKLQKEALHLEISSSQKEAENAARYLNNVKATIENSRLLPYRESLSPLLSATLSTTKGLAVLLPTLAPFKESFNRLGFTTFKETSGAIVPPSSPTETEAHLTEAGENFSYALAEMKQLKKERVPLIFREKFEQLNQTLLSLMPTAELLKILNADLADLLGQKGRKTYLLLLQNSNELRPNGGFIGSYARLVLDNGYLKDLKIDDIYNPDGLLDEKKIFMIPPTSLKENLGVENLRLRDANWSASFPESGKVIGELYQKATNEKINGLIALDLAVIARLLKVLGPINLPTYNETVDAENLFEKAQFHTEAGFFPGSTSKKTFLSLLGGQLLANLFELKPAQLPPFLAALEESLTKKGLLLYLPESRLNAYLNQRGWDGAVKENKGDYLMLVEANVGSTKANYFIRRQVKYSIERVSREGEMEAALSLNYLHTGKDNNWPGGPYKSYLRLLVPKRSALLKVTRSTGNIEEKGEDITEKIKIGEETGKTTFEVLFNLKAGESLALNFSYVIPPEVLNLPSARSYRLLLQKQPGAGEDPLTVGFNPPFGKQLSGNIGLSGWEKIGGRARWQGTFDRDLDFTLPFE